MLLHLYCRSIHKKHYTIFIGTTIRFEVRIIVSMKSAWVDGHERVCTEAPNLLCYIVI